MLSEIIGYFNYPFVRYAFIVGILISLCSSLLGVTLVLKRFSFIGDGLSHVAFGALAIASVLNLTNEMIIVLPVTVVCAILLLKTGKSTKLRGDASLAMLSVGAMGIGYLIMNAFPASSNVSGDVCTTLFGSTSIITLTRGEVILCAVLSVLVVAVFAVFSGKLFAVTFDEAFSRAAGLNTSAYNMLIATMTAVVIVLAMKLVGSLLISALVIFPAISALRLFKSFKPVMIFSVLFSVVCTAMGIILSIISGTPVGATIVAVDIAAFLGCAAVGRLKRIS